jgi:hypothetical protein
VTDSDNKTRASRDSETHDKQARRRPWRPVRKLETPPAPPGYTYRWIRESMLGQEDRANVSRRIREGWELVKASDLPPEWELPYDGCREARWSHIQRRIIVGENS